MRRPILLACMALAVAPAAVAKPGPSRVEVREPWSRPAVAGGNGVGYMLLVNRGRTAKALARVESPAARRVEMHRSSLDHGVMSMAAQPSIEIPAGGAVVFAPGAYHLMFVDLGRALKPGDRLPATLVFSDGRRLPVAFAVGSGVGPPHAAGGA
ncbi:copper chaperone PCu(A)C [Phenylobacterium sp.]|uniref:copper chaperone PCu(A)C n=1 Tax=Phenylobacterium sp. TaxID=1871053 RepID=UPI002DF3D0BD|nr:copper chaperone PCu(A)C [Phenylobacterium sp.]